MNIIFEGEEQATLKRAISKKGVEHQLSILTEEMGECIAAISHYQRRREGSYSEMMEEMADVLVCLMQFYLRNGENISYHWGQKMQRLKKRLEDKDK